MSTLGRLGRYELVRKIAAGGMAEIFLARQWGAAGFFRDVVIKRLFRHLAEHPSQLRMFQDEGRLLAALSHPNIPQVYDVGNADGYWYIAMELVDGYTLADAFQLGVRNGLPMPLPVAIGIVMQTCEALHHAHERTDRARRPLRIVHRDITPQNIMLTRDGVAKLMDFGVASTAARKDTEAGAVRGTFAYMAPEQIRARPLDKRADVFGLGVILYELTTGSRLFRGSDVQVMTQVVEQDVAPPSSRDPHYPADLEEIVLATLARDRGRRVPSTAHLAQRLEELAQRNGILVGPRAVARWVGQVLPAEQVREEELAMVQPPSYAIDEEGAGAQEEYVDPNEVGDDEGMLEDLRLLSLPPEPIDDDVPDAFRDLPDGLEGEGNSVDVDLDQGLDDLLAEGDVHPYRGERAGHENGGHGEGYAGHGDAEHADEHAGHEHARPSDPGHSGESPLVLDGFDEGDAERPVLLLDAPKRAPSSAPSPGPRGQRRGHSFVDELERKLIEEEENREPDDPEGAPP
jgi:tRNA A-37 threonylcarbamoyl transferase component Bud32